jgi:hypothetical protein
MLMKRLFVFRIEAIRIEIVPCNFPGIKASGKGTMHMDHEGETTETVAENRDGAETAKGKPYDEKN